VPPFDAWQDRRHSRRLAMGCKARIKSLNTGETHYGECTDLSVDGLALRSSFVPQPKERLRVIVIAPSAGGMPGQTLDAEVEVRRCNEIERGRLYEIGTRIIVRHS